MGLGLSKLFSYSHTFENRSSLAANPLGGFTLELFPVLTPGDTGAALDHPPKSSSADTVGLVESVPTVLNPPLFPGTMLELASCPLEPQPKSLALG